MSIVPREVYLRILDSVPDETSNEAGMRIVANRAAEWALEQAIAICRAHQAAHNSATGRDDFYACDYAKADACDEVEEAIRALLKGGESDESAK